MKNSSVSLITALVATIMFVAPFSGGVTLKDSSASVRDRNRALDPSHNRQAVSAGARATANPEKPPATTQAARVIGKIAFASDRDGNFEIYSMDADGGGQTRLTETPAEDYGPAWSPDGTRLAFVSTRDGNAEIYVMNADGTGQTRLTNNTASDLTPVWKPDGSQIGFVSNRDGNDEIYLMNPDGSNQTNLTQNQADDSSFSFSPQGNVITFSSAREDGDFDIYTMNANGGGVVRLTTSAGADINPTWSAQKITFQTNRDENDEIYSMGFNGGNQTRLTNNPEFDIDPAQSSDGTRICFATARDGNLEIYLMNADGTSLVRLTNNNAADIQPALQLNGVIPLPPSPGAASVQFSASNYSVNEGDAFATLTVIRTGDTSGISTVDFASVNGSATNRADYTYHFGTLRFNPGETSKTFIVLITDDVFIENDETITVTLSNPTGAVLGGLNTATLVIVDNDSAPPNVNPIDNARFFVTQHYADFLNRAPDQSGLDFWTNQITECGNNLPCLQLRRINVSAAFFLSIEFQQTGYLVYRIYKVAYGNLPGAPVPLRLNEFLPDTQQIGLGVIVGATGWEQQLENNKNAFVLDFVLRLRFTAAYPMTMSPVQFVDALYANAGVTPSATERTAAINEFGSATTTADTAARARVLRRVTENSSLAQQEFNKAFVLMQYFGYLRRNPNEAPDTDFSGYNFWLNKLNQFNGNFINAEMVKSFLDSGEYRRRFGP
ncbi:MAG: PD40 domain-containing protein [Blastocatellia bacterium]|nr:PD40 domain-containing protein [Blastocatellia bacterium]